MKTLFLFTDTETTGLKFEHEQVLSFSVVLSSLSDVLLAYEQNIFLKSNVLPNASALIVNNMNPFSDEYKKTAISEYDGVYHIANLLQKYKDEGFRIVIVAYNAEYDETMLELMFARCGVNWKSLVTNIWDPLEIAKELINSKILNTREVKGFGGKSYNSARLEDVYHGLGFSSAGLTAHNALDDTKMLKTAVEKLYLLYTSKDFENIHAEPAEYVDGQYLSLVLNKGMSMIKTTVKVLKNDLDLKKMLVLDYAKLSDSAYKDKLSECIIELKHTEIFDELDLSSKEMIFLENYYKNNSSFVQKLVSEIELKSDEVIPLENDISDLEKIVQKFKNSENKSETYKNLSPEERSKVLKAESYSYARYNFGWSFEIFGKNYKDEVSYVYEIDGHRIGLDPFGRYIIKKGDDLILTTEKKTEVQQKLTSDFGLDTKSKEYKEISSLLSPVKSFTNPKHSFLLKKEFNEKRAEVFNGANKIHKDIMSGLLSFYKENNPESFKDLSLPSFKINLGAFKKPE